MKEHPTLPVEVVFAGPTSALAAVWLLACGILAPAGCTSAPQRAAVSGTATYRERVALPPGAVFEAVIEDVSRADAPATVIGTTQVENPGNPPYAFSIPYEPAAVDGRNTYSVRARIRLGDRLLFATDSLTPVITRGNPTTVSLVLRSVGSVPKGPWPGLEGTTWTLVRLGGTPVTVAAGQQAPDLSLDASAQRAAGSSGCNRFTGSYRLEGNRLTFGALATTRRICPQAMELEQRYLAALGRVATWQLEDERLLLRDVLGVTVGEFVPSGRR